MGRVSGYSKPISGTGRFKFLNNYFFKTRKEGLRKAILFFHTLKLKLQLSGLPGGTSDKEPTCKSRRHKRHRFDPWVGKIPWRRAWQPTPVFLPGKSHAQQSLVGYSPQGCTESDTTEVTEITSTQHTPHKPTSSSSPASWQGTHSPKAGAQLMF